MQICSEYTVPSGRSDGPAVLFSVLTTNTPIGIMAAYQVRYRKAVTYVAVDGSFAGFLALSDTLRQESAETIAALSGLGVQPILLTGDHENAARTIALAIIGTLDPVVGALVHNAGSVLVITNSAFLLNWRKKT